MKAIIVISLNSYCMGIIAAFGSHVLACTLYCYKARSNKSVRWYHVYSLQYDKAWPAWQSIDGVTCTTNQRDRYEWQTGITVAMMMINAATLRTCTCKCETGAITIVIK